MVVMAPLQTFTFGTCESNINSNLIVSGFCVSHSLEKLVIFLGRSLYDFVDHFLSLVCCLFCMWHVVVMTLPLCFHVANCSATICQCSMVSRLSLYHACFDVQSVAFNSYRADEVCTGTALCIHHLRGQGMCDVENVHQSGTNHCGSYALKKPFPASIMLGVGLKAQVSQP